MSYELHFGDCVEVMARWEDNCIDAIVTDPPYGLSFMGKGWDSLGDMDRQIEWHRFWLEQAHRVLKPGGYLLAFNHSRLYHYLACAIEKAQLELRDSIDWLYFNGFPKSKNDVSDGTGTALKPAKEPIAMARKPLGGTHEDAYARWGTGVLNIDACRVASIDNPSAARRASGAVVREAGTWANDRRSAETFQRERTGEALGRWPSNIIIDDLVACELDLRCGEVGAKAPVSGNEPSVASEGLVTNKRARVKGAFHGDKGGPSRFFYTAKPTRKEREFGCEDLPLKSAGEVTDREDGSAGLNSPRAGAGRTGGARNHHPTLKPVALMRYLCRLVTPARGLVLDPFMGSGTTGIAALREGFQFVGVEKDLQYLTIAAARVSAAEKEQHEGSEGVEVERDAGDAERGSDGGSAAA